MTKSFHYVPLAETASIDVYDFNAFSAKLSKAADILLLRGKIIKREDFIDLVLISGGQVQAVFSTRYSGEEYTEQLNQLQLAVTGVESSLRLPQKAVSIMDDFIFQVEEKNHGKTK
jgi:hypothetical protein